MDLQQTQDLRQTTRLAMTQQMRQSLELLQMPLSDLALFLEDEASENPCLQVTLPKPFARDTGPRPEFGGLWDATAALPSGQPGLYAAMSGFLEGAFSDRVESDLALGFLEALEPSGWLSKDVAEVALACGASEARAKAVLARIQKQVEPAGLFARSLGECLHLQAAAEDALTWELETLIANLPLLADGRRAELAALCDCDIDDLGDILAQLRAFDPKPGLQFENDLPPIFPPDLSVRKTAQGWDVALTRGALPSLQVLESDGAPEKARQEARALANALERRQATLLRVGTALVRHQQDYFEHGAGHLRALTLEMLSVELGLHASTISRACAGRMMDGPKGAFPMRSLFSRPLEPDFGTSALSQDALVEKIRNLIAGEPATRPLSDAAIQRALLDDGVSVARRTVAKHRARLGFPASAQRRRQAFP